jgi:hypothetical protein
MHLRAYSNTFDNLGLVALEEDLLGMLNMEIKVLSKMFLKEKKGLGNNDDDVEVYGYKYTRYKNCCCIGIYIFIHSLNNAY